MSYFIRRRCQQYYGYYCVLKYCTTAILMCENKHVSIIINLVYKSQNAQLLKQGAGILHTAYA